MYRFAQVLLPVLLMTASLHAQPDTLWTAKIPHRLYPEVYMIPTQDGGYAFGGAVQVLTDERDDTDMALMKVDSLGQFQWLQSYSPPLRPDSIYWFEQVFAIRETADRGFILAGGGGYGLIVKTDSLGNQEWFHQYAVQEGGFRTVSAGTLTDDGDLLIAEREDVFLLDIEREGEILWHRNYDLNNSEAFFEIVNAEDGGFLMAGYTSALGAGSGDFYAIRIDRNGEVIWNRAYGTGDYEICVGATAMSNDGWCLVGSSRFGMLDSVNAMIVRIDVDGNELWRQIVEEEQHHNNFLNSVVETRDGGVAAVGEGYRVPSDRSDMDALLIRTDAEGELLWRKYYSSGRGTEKVESIVLLEDDAFMLGGFASGVWLIRTEPDPSAPPRKVVDLLDPAFPSFIVLDTPYPNPFNSTTTISFSLPRPGRYAIEVVDIQGRLVTRLSDGWKAAGSYRQVWNVKGANSGIYFVRLETPSFTMVNKMTLVK